MAGVRNIVITGGTSGIGLALAKRISKAHRVIVTGRKLSPELEALIAERPDLSFVALDQSDPIKAAETLMKSLKKRNWDKINNVVLNAGAGSIGEPAGETAGLIRQTMTVNLGANFAFAHVLYEPLKAAGGKLTLVGSSARKGANNFATYAASKSALHGFARALREEWRDAVDVQIVHPAATRTPMHKKAGYNPGLLKVFFVSADDMAAMMEKAIARGRPFTRLTLSKYWNGSAILGRGL